MTYVRPTVVLATVATLATLAACRGATLAPRHLDVDSARRLGGGVTAALTGTDTARFSITIDPWHTASYALGDGNAITFPAGSICDPSSTDGEPEQDAPCTAIRKSITVHVTAWLDNAGHTRVDVAPHLRSVPSLLPTGWVTITFTDFQASLSPRYTILYCPTGNSACFDESQADPTLVTLRNVVTGEVTRRIKHFSGYVVGAAGA